MPSSKLVKEPGRRLTVLTFLKPRGQQKIATGGRLFGYDDFLTSQQVSSYFSRLAPKRSVEVDHPNSEEETPGEDIQSMLRDKVLSEVSIQH